jgi:hypothetical protein
VTTFLADIRAGSPVLGFLPGLSFLFKILKFPNPEIFTSSLFTKEFFIY